MSKSGKLAGPASEMERTTSPALGPQVFISHDTRDAELAEAFSKLLRSVSSGMIKSFRSSDKKGDNGIAFGDEWCTRLMTMLQTTSDVVCLFTERSIDRPWILYEAGVAKGRLNTTVLGVALGVPLSRVSAGPFYQFQNSDDSEVDLAKLVKQLAKRIPSIELDEEVVKTQVAAFRSAEAAILAKLAKGQDNLESSLTADDPVAKIFEEMKALPSRVAERLHAEPDELSRGKRLHRFNPKLVAEILNFADNAADPAAIIMVASLIKDDVPWLYDLAMEIYRTVRSGDPEAIECEMHRLKRFAEFAIRARHIGDPHFSRETGVLLMEMPHLFERVLARALTSVGEQPTTGSKKRRK